MNTEVLFSSKKMDWATPQKLYDELNGEFHFCGDLAASRDNAKHSNYFSEEDNALIQNWRGLTTHGWLFCNPPYGRGIGEWVKKAYTEHLRGARIVMLLPSRTGTKWFQNYVVNQPHVTIRFLPGRLKFGDSKNSAPFDSLLAIFDGSMNNE